MTSVASINNFLKRNILYILLIIIALAFRIWDITESFPFDYDQAISAQIAYDFFVNHKLSLIGQELSFQGFYLGPLHNWVQFTPYYFCNLQPDCVPHFYLIISIITIVITYFLLKRIFSTAIAFIVALIYSISYTAISFERGVNSNYFLFFTTVVVIYCLHEYYLNKNKFLIIGAFFTGIAVVNFNPVFIFSTAFFYISTILRGRINIKYYVLSLVAFFINYLPLAVFDYRHDHILLNNLANFFNQNTANEDFFYRLHFLIGKIFVPFNTYYLFHSTKIWYVIIFLTTLIPGVIVILKSKSKLYISLLIWPPLVILGFLFYKGHIPDYYFQQFVVVILIILAFALAKKPIIAIAFIALLTYVNVNLLVHSKYPINYQLKKKVVNSILESTKEDSFNVYYSMPPGLNTGYSTIFKLYQRYPQENQKNLYIIDYSDAKSFDMKKYAQLGKVTQVQSFDSFLRVVSVK
ncbi:MAG: glycosyltransferase family 39 protein [Patescibacteria group bacterium]